MKPLKTIAWRRRVPPNPLAIAVANAQAQIKEINRSFSVAADAFNQRLDHWNALIASEKSSAKKMFVAGQDVPSRELLAENKQCLKGLILGVAQSAQQLPG